jgi:hypothetical protein
MNTNGLSLLLTFVVAFSPLLSAQVGTPAITVHDLFEQDQGDQQIDADSLPPAEQQKLRIHYDQREDQVKLLIQNGEILKPQDFFDAGVILTHSHVPEDQLLAHLAFTAAAFEGIVEAKHLAATSLDRYLVFSKQTPIFGTIFQLPYQGWHHDASPSMNDSMRAAFCIPSLKQLDKEFEQQKNGKDLPESGHDQFWNVELKACH